VLAAIAAALDLHRDAARARGFARRRRRAAPVDDDRRAIGDTLTSEQKDALAVYRSARR
jgi:hypothetical protein